MGHREYARTTSTLAGGLATALACTALGAASLMVAPALASEGGGGPPAAGQSSECEEAARRLLPHLQRLDGVGSPAEFLTTIQAVAGQACGFDLLDRRQGTRRNPAGSSPDSSGRNPRNTGGNPRLNAEKTSEPTRLCTAEVPGVGSLYIGVSILGEELASDPQGITGAFSQRAFEGKGVSLAMSLLGEPDLAPGYLYVLLDDPAPYPAVPAPVLFGTIDTVCLVIKVGSWPLEQEVEVPCSTYVRGNLIPVVPGIISIYGAGSMVENAGLCFPLDLPEVVLPELPGGKEALRLPGQRPPLRIG